MVRVVQSDLFQMASRLSELFSTQPIAGGSKVPWKTRELLERELAFSLGIKDKHICVDGPSGSGKTSLVQRVLFREKIPFIHIQISRDWDWADFTRQFVEIPQSTKHHTEASFKGFLNIFRPGLELGVLYKGEFDESIAFDLLLKKSASWRSNDLAEWIHINKMVLIVDDLEMASDSILDGLAACSKLLGQSYIGKIVFIGIDDIMRKIVSRNVSLSRRVSEISVGGLSNIGESSDFIFDKFSGVNILTPDKIQNTKKDDVAFCRRLIYDAANGLMKDLNDLGMSLARRAHGRNRLTVADFRDVCLTFLQETRRKNRKRIVGISNVLRNNDTYIRVFDFLIRRSASSITKLYEIDEAMDCAYTQDELLSALDFLEGENIITVTGIEEVRVFFKDPPLFNCIRAHLYHGGEYGWDIRLDQALSPSLGQLPLPLIGGRSSPAQSKP